MRLECRSLDPGALVEKGIGGIVDCKITGCDGCVGDLGKAYEVVESSLRALGVNAPVTFSENESIGDSYMIYKFHLVEGDFFLASVRLITRFLTPIRLVITIDKSAMSMARSATR